MKINAIHAREILDSRGTPTVAAEVILENGCRAEAAVPSGASTGEHEAVELRDGDPARYFGKGVLKAVSNVNNIIAPALKGQCVFEQQSIDKVMRELDGTPNKSRLGANAILAVSLAVAKAAAACQRVPLYRYLGTPNSNVLPVPMMNIINAGSHSDSPIAFQEFMIRPVGANTFRDGLRMGAEVFHSLKGVLKERGFHTTVGDEGGFAPSFNNIEEVLDLIMIAIDRAGYIPGVDMTIALDCAASEFYKEERYDYAIFEGPKGRRLTMGEQVDYLKSLINKYPIDSIEDGMSENDWLGWDLLTTEIGDRCQLVGDDLFVTNIDYLAKGIKTGAANAVLVKLNQIGTLTETMETIAMAQRHGYKAIVSHRSGETEDTAVADIAVAMNAPFVKFGAPCRGERTAKYNRLLRIENQLGSSAVFGVR